MKKLKTTIGSILAFIMLLTFAAAYGAQGASAEPVFGDLDGSGIVDIDDILLVRDIIFGDYNAPQTNGAVFGDLNGDGQVNIL
ncbi:MAG: hypothetical protein FWD16_06320, partial [Clostridia bacterium]|nr:hypothetical protein [Clostridia bacterium]